MQRDRRPAEGDSANWRHVRRERQRQTRQRRRRLLAAGSLLVVIAAIVGVVLASGGSKGSGGHASEHRTATSNGSHRHSAAGNGSEEDALPTGVAAAGRDVSAPVLMYHVINPAPADAPFPGLYVPSAEFAEQMQALAKAGFHAVTLQQLWRHWNQGSPLPVNPVVITFDNGYQSQYTNALPVLRRLRWKAVENMQLTGLPPSQGGLSEAQVKGLIAAGWELDTQGFSHADLVTLSASELQYQVARSRQTIQRRYQVPVHWFCYPSGHYNATVIAAVKEAGYLGSTTVVPGWASPGGDPYKLPRLRVLGGTSGAGLVELIKGTEHDPPPPSSYS